MRLDNYGLADISEWLRAHVAARHEADRENEWTVTDAPPNFIDAQLRGIVGIELHVARATEKRN
ncbi:FMN-binding negative transcriptional regulator [Rhodococcus sp. P-2]|uniref:FMN-binding negative transcriptional regulator n=1 Tax=Rhodococcus sp. P-2 TaxID=2795031 RepID=UPI001F3AB7E1|nr:FMN-binding negative transcriptional regulator [Rhodococcus sp. P-2]